MAFTWSQSLSVGIAEIDNQHRELFARVNRLLDAMSRGKGKEEIAKLVDFLEQYVVSHFGAEERRMAEAAYPGLASHKVQHAAFLKDLTVLKRRLETEGPTGSAVIGVQRRVCDWLVEHIGGTDRMFGSHVLAGR